MKKLIAILLAILMILSITACGAKNDTAKDDGGKADDSSASSDTKQDGADSGQIQLGVAFDYVSDFMAFAADGVTKFDEEHDDVTVTLTSAEFDIPTQISQVENMLTQGSQAILIKPVDSNSCESIIEACDNANVPLISVVGRINADGVFCHVGLDNYDVGYEQGKWIAEKLGGKGNVCFLLGDLGLADAVDRTEGAKDALAELAPDIEIIDEQLASWMREEGVAKMENWLQSSISDQINGVIANNDEMAIGAAIACEEAGRNDIFITGVDGTEAFPFIADGSVLGMSVYQDGVSIAYTACQIAYDYIVDGKTPDGDISVPAVVVTADNVSDFYS